MADEEAVLDTRADERAVRKVFRHLVPWCMAFYILAYVDRINIGFAALSMNADLGLTATMFGLANTLSYLTYTGFEVPSTMMLARFGARRWIPRIMVTWGLASMATAFAVGPKSLYGLRTLVGLAEAGLTPGILFYLGHWFPLAHRARANSIFLASLPIVLMSGATLSGVILQMDGLLGLAGWRWLFLCEGLPSIILGAAVLFFLPNGPSEATWLSPEERQALLQRMEEERASHPMTAARQKHGAWIEIRRPRVFVLSLVYFCIQATANTLGIWTPLIVKEFLGGTNRMLVVSLMSAIPPFFSIIAMQLVSVHSDRTSERSWHVIGSMASCAAGWMLVALSPIAGFKLIGLTLCFGGIYSALSVFWATVGDLISRSSQAVGIGLISTLGTLASIVSPYIIGKLRDLTQNFNAGIWYVTALLVLGIISLATIAKPKAGVAPV
jgi:ACS family 4-hydroxyphenylacetate permease-like MFS transporter